MLLEAFFFWEAPTHNRGFPLSVTLFMVNSTSSRSCSDKSHFHKHMHCVCTQVAQKKKRCYQVWEEERDYALHLSDTFTVTWVKTKKQKKKWRFLEWQWVLRISKLSLSLCLLLPDQSSVKCKGNWFGQSDC